MSALVATYHAAVRMAQRGILLEDADLIALIGTEVESGYLVRTQDCRAAESEIKRLLERIRRLRGKRLVTAGDRIVTAFHASRRQERKLLRFARERNLKDE